MWPCRRPVEYLVAALACTVLPTHADETLLLALRLNGVDPGREAWVLRDEAGQFALEEADWSALGLAPTPLRWHAGRAYRQLRDGGLSARLHAATQTLEIEAPPQAFGHYRLDAALRPAQPPSRAGAGAVFNYDLELRGDERRRGGHGWLEALAFSPDAGDLRLSGLWRSHGTGRSRWTRLDTTWTRDFPAQMASLRLGDAISHGGSWGQPLRFAGLQWGTDFALRPGFVAHPLPSIQGSAALPSTLDLYVDNVQRWQQAVPAGSFDLVQLPVTNGQGEVRLVVRDLLGREQVVLQPYHVSSALLSPGLQTYSMELGRLRQGYGQATDHYGDWFGSATYRLGVLPHYTHEWRAEMSPRHGNVGAAGTWLLPGLGTLQLGLAVGRSERRSGELVSLVAERSSRRFSAGVRLRWASPHFGELAQDRGSASRHDISASVGTSVGRASLGLNLVDRRRADGQRLRLLGSHVTTDLGPWGALGLFMHHDQRSGQTVVALSLTRVLDDRQAVSAAVQRGGPQAHWGQMQWQALADEPQGLGGRLALDAGRSPRAVAEGIWNTPYVRLGGGVAQTQGGRGGTDWRAAASGGAAWLGDTAFLARRVEGSFVVVDADGHAGVPVLLENRVAAHTDQRGLAIVHGLRPYETQRLGIDASALPMDVEVGTLVQTVTPPARSGMRLAVPLRRAEALRFRLVDAEGRPWPAGTRLHIDGRPLPLPLGYDGLAYTPPAAEGATLQARWGERECTRTLPSLPSGGGVGDERDLGALVCP